MTVLFTDIVTSTDVASQLGDARWRELLSRHHALVRRELKRHGGREVDTAGDGFFATFPAPVDGVRCACAVSDAVRDLGIEIRAGLHFGEVELMRPKVAGIAVVTASRIAALARPGEVLVSSTIEELVAGSGIEFIDRGSHPLKGVSGEKHLFAVQAVEGNVRAQPIDAATSKERLVGIEPPAKGGRHTSWIVAAGVIVATGVAALAATLVFSSHTTPYVPGIDTVTRIDADSNAFDQPVRVGVQPTGIAFAGDSMWVINLTDQTVTQVDPSTGAVIATKSAQGSPTGIAGGPEGLFITTGFGAVGGASQVMSVNLNTNQVQPFCEVPPGTKAIAEGSGYIWVSVANRAEMWRISPDQCDPKKIPLGAEADPEVMAIGGQPSRVWAGDALASTAYRLDPGSMSVAPYGTSGSPTGIALGAGSVWITVGANDQVARLDPASGQTQTIIESADCNQPQGIAVADDGVWVGCYGSRRLIRIDPSTDKVVQTLAVGGAPDAVVADANGDVWVTVHEP